MPYIVIENFNGGMDTRRMAASGTPGTLLELTNAHITRGGEIEKRKAFESLYLVTGTLGLAKDADGLVVFGSDANPGVPSGVTYQRLQHPDGHDMTRLRSWDLYAGKLYVAAEFSNGDILHFYDATRVETWFDGKARGTFVVRKTGTEPGDRSGTSFDMSKDSEELQVEVFMTNVDDPENPISLTGGSVNIASGTSSTSFAATIESEINANTGTTGVEAIYYLIGSDGVLIRSADRYTNLDGREVWWEVSELNIFKAASGSSPRSARCLAEGSCTNVFNLNAGAVGGVEPYTYTWSIVGDGGAVSATLDETTVAEPTLTVSHPTTGSTSGQCNTVGVTLKVVVEDDASPSQTVEKVFSVTSTHCPPNAYERPGGGGGTVYNQVN